MLQSHRVDTHHLYPHTPTHTHTHIHTYSNRSMGKGSSSRLTSELQAVGLAPSDPRICCRPPVRLLHDLYSRPKQS